MTIRRTLTFVPAVASILSLLCLLVLYPALNDIYCDYVSAKAIYEQEVAVTLPGWTACFIEWRVVTIAWWAMLVLNVGMVVLCVWQGRQLRKGEGK